MVMSGCLSFWCCALVTRLAKSFREVWIVENYSSRNAAHTPVAHLLNRKPVLARHFGWASKSLNDCFFVAHQAAFFSGGSKTSGRKSFKYISLAAGMPSFRHCDTAPVVTLQISATRPVPPRASMILFVSMRQS